MRKIIFVSVFLITSFFISGCSKLVHTTVEESLKESNTSFSEIYHEEKYGDTGKVVFYGVSNPKNIGMSYLEETSSGWKWIDGTEHLLFEDLHVHNPTEKLTWFGAYQVNTKEVASEKDGIPMFMGLIIDPDIERVIVKAVMDTPFSIEEDISIEADIIQRQGSRIWYVLNPRDDLIRLCSGPINILGLSKNGDILYESFRS